MKNILFAVLVGAMTCATALAQNTPASSQGQNAQPATAASTSANGPMIAPGSVIPVQLAKTVDAKKAKTGDQVVAVVTQDMKNQSGEVLVPKDTKVLGHVTAAQPHSKEQKESQLAIAFDHAVLKNEPVQMPMSIQAVIAPLNNNDNESAPSGAPSPRSPAGESTSPMAGRNPMASGQQPPPQAGSTGDSGNPQAKLPPINAQTQGVIGISNVTLSAGSSPGQSLLTSEKNTVKLETGTMLLLKVQ